MCCPASLQGRTSLAAILPSSQLLQDLPHLQRPSPRSSPAAHVGSDSDRQHSPQHSWPGWPTPLRTYITVHLLPLPSPVSSSSPSQWLNLLNIESTLRHCEVCQPPCHYCQTINPTNPAAEAGCLETPETTSVVLNILAFRSKLNAVFK